MQKQIALALKKFALNPFSIVMLVTCTWRSCKMPPNQLCRFQPRKAVTMASQCCCWTVTQYEGELVFVVSSFTLDAGSYHKKKKKSNFLYERGKIIFLVPCVESCCILLLSLWSYQLSNFITLQIQWKWSLLWQENWGDDQMIQFLSQTRGGNLPLISFYRVTGGLLYLKPVCYLHLCCVVQEGRWNEVLGSDFNLGNIEAQFVMCNVW